MTFGTVEQITASYEYNLGLISDDEFSQRVGGTGIMQLAGAGVAQYGNTPTFDAWGASVAGKLPPELQYLARTSVDNAWEKGPTQLLKDAGTYGKSVRQANSAEAAVQPGVAGSGWNSSSPMRAVADSVDGSFGNLKNIKFSKWENTPEAIIDHFHKIGEPLHPALEARVLEMFAEGRQYAPDGHSGATGTPAFHAEVRATNQALWNIGKNATLADLNSTSVAVTRVANPATKMAARGIRTGDPALMCYHCEFLLADGPLVLTQAAGLYTAPNAGLINAAVTSGVMSASITLENMFDGGNGGQSAAFFSANRPRFSPHSRLPVPKDHMRGFFR